MKKEEIKKEIFDILNISGEYLLNVKEAPTMQKIYNISEKILKLLDA